MHNLWQDNILLYTLGFVHVKYGNEYFFLPWFTELTFTGIVGLVESACSWGFTARSTARTILGQVLSIATCGSQTHTEVTSCKLDAKLANHYATEDLVIRL